MTTQDAIDHFGSIIKLADSLDFCSREDVFLWGEYPPIDKQYVIYLATAMKLKPEGFRDDQD